MSDAEKKGVSLPMTVTEIMTLTMAYMDAGLYPIVRAAIALRQAAATVPAPELQESFNAAAQLCEVASKAIDGLRAETQSALVAVNERLLGAEVAKPVEAPKPTAAETFDGIEKKLYKGLN